MIIVTADGCCINYADDPTIGFGGWAATIHGVGVERMLQGKRRDTTAIVMEVEAVLTALDSLLPGEEFIGVHTDVILLEEWWRFWLEGNHPAVAQSSKHRRTLHGLWHRFSASLTRHLGRVEVKHISEPTEAHKRCHDLAYEMAASLVEGSRHTPMKDQPPTLLPKGTASPNVRLKMSKSLNIRDPRHLPECDGVYCMFGCPVLHERFSPPPVC